VIPPWFTRRRDFVDFLLLFRTAQAVDNGAP